MSKSWLEWYLEDGRIKICRGTVNDEPEVSVYKKNEEGKYELVTQVIGAGEAVTDMLTRQFIAQYDTEKVFSKSTGLGKAKAFINSSKRFKGN